MMINRNLCMLKRVNPLSKESYEFSALRFQSLSCYNNNDNDYQYYLEERNMDRLKLFRNVIISGLLMIIGYFTNQNAILILAIVIGGYEETLEGLKDTFENKSLNVELLMILSAIGATLIGYTMEGAILIFIFALAGSLEEVTLDRSQREIQSLMELQPTE